MFPHGRKARSGKGVLMNSRRDGILREMGLAPLWRLCGAEGVEEGPVGGTAPPVAGVREARMPPVGLEFKNL